MFWKPKEKKIIVYTMYGNLMAVPNFQASELEVTKILEILSALSQRQAGRVGLLNGGYDMRIVELKGEG